MEATGIYWKPVWQILSDNEFTLVLANASHVKNVQGRKTDCKFARNNDPLRGIFACKSGSDSFLVQFWIRVAFPFGESAPCSKHFAAPVWCRPGLLWKLRSMKQIKPLSLFAHRLALVFAHRAAQSRAAFVATTDAGSGTFHCRGGWSSS
jgi:hypothetical protein